MKIYVGNLSYETGDGDLRRAFEAHGEVSGANVITDRDTGRSRGFGFVEMPDKGSAEAALQALNGKELDGRTLTVNEAKPREERGGGRAGSGRTAGGRSW